MVRLKAPKLSGPKNLSEGQKRKRKRKNTFAKLDQRVRNLKEKEQENPFESKINKTKFKVIQRKEQPAYNTVKAKENAFKLVLFFVCYLLFYFIFYFFLELENREKRQ
jgi:hypothetical protein